MNWGKALVFLAKGIGYLGCILWMFALCGMFSASIGTFALFSPLLFIGVFLLFWTEAWGLRKVREEEEKHVTAWRKHQEQLELEKFEREWEENRAWRSVAAHFHHVLIRNLVEDSRVSLSLYTHISAYYWKIKEGKLAWQITQN